MRKKGGRKSRLSQSAAKTYQGVTTVVMKNWEPFVLGPALAMERRPGVVCWRGREGRREGGREGKIGEF